MKTLLALAALLAVSTLAALTPTVKHSLTTAPPSGCKACHD